MNVDQAGTGTGCSSAEPQTEQEKDAIVLPSVAESLQRGLDLKRWWDEVERNNGPKEQFPIERSFNRPTRSFGFYGDAPVGGDVLPVMGNVQEMFYDQTRSPARLSRESTAWLKSQLREFVMKYFMRISSFREPEAYVDYSQANAAPAVAFLSWCPQPIAQNVGFGFTQLFHKPAGSSAVYAFPSYQRHTIVDQREIGNTLEWIVLKVRIFDFNFTFRPWGTSGPELVFGENEESYLVVNRDLVDFQDEPFQTDNGRTVLGEYGIGYSFIKSPAPGRFGYGPGEFDAAIELIKFRIYDTGYISVRMIFVANRLHKVLNVVVDPLDWGLGFADRISFGLASGVLGPARNLLKRLPLRFTVDPVSTYISIANSASGQYAQQQLCVSLETLEKLFLLKHYQQHFAAVLGTLLTWRQIPDWLDEEKLPPWIITGLGS
jgi:hypothetical protein